MNEVPDFDLKTKLRRAWRMAFSAAPWLFVVGMIPSVIEGTFAARTMLTALATTALGVPLLLLIGIAVQSFPRSWYR